MANELPGAAQRYQVLTITFSITAFVLLLIGSIRCNFVKFTDTSGTSEPVSLQFGVWNYMYWSMVASVDGVFLFESCHWYPDFTDIDPAWKAARAFSVLGWIFAIIMMVVACISVCADMDTPTKATPKFEAPLYLLTATFIGLILLLLDSNACKSNVLVQLQDAALTNISFPDTCSIATGAKLVISSTVFYFASAVTSFLGYRASQAEMAADGTDAGLDQPLNP